MTEGDPELDLVGLAERLQAACLAAGLTVATAESCTGGLVAHALTEIPGSSAYFLGGVVAYADATKQAELDVPRAMIERHGAVSAQVARAMAEGARRRRRLSPRRVGDRDCWTWWRDRRQARRPDLCRRRWTGRLRGPPIRLGP